MTDSESHDFESSSYTILVEFVKEGDFDAKSHKLNKKVKELQSHDS